MGTVKPSIKPRAPYKPKVKKKRPNSSKRFWISIAALVGLILLVIYVEFFAEKKAPPWPAGHTVYGIDVSRYQEDVDWSKVHESEIVFAFVKATEGVSLKDVKFEQNWDGASTAGVIRGAYHFYLPSLNPKDQAKHFISTVSLKAGDMPPVLDVEVKGKKPVETFREDIKIWLREVEGAYGVKPIIYTGYKFYVDYLQGHFNDYPLWIAHYEVPKLKLEKDKDNNLVFWQHTDAGIISGIAGDVDCNVFFGSMRELREVCIKE